MRAESTCDSTLPTLRSDWHRRATTCVFLALLVAFGGLSHVARSQTPPPAKPSPTTAPIHRVMVFGDSLSAAYNIDPAKGWVQLMANRLQQRKPPATVINASISGETTQGGKARLGTDLARHKPSIVLLELGANDALRGLPLADTRRNLESMIAAIRAAGAQPILIGIQIPPNYGPQYAQEFRDLFAQVARQTRTPLVPFLLEGIADQRDMFLPDGLHPTAEAQPRLVNNVLPAVENALRGKAGS